MAKFLFSATVALGAIIGTELNDDSFDRFRDTILPSAEERAFLDIPWRESFWSAVTEARDADRPILLWAMNGHPLGCT
jgi:hypothetical protein